MVKSKPTRIDSAKWCLMNVDGCWFGDSTCPNVLTIEEYRPCALRRRNLATSGCRGADVWRPFPFGCVWKCWVNLPNEIAIFHRDNDQQNHWGLGVHYFQTHQWSSSGLLERIRWRQTCRKDAGCARSSKLLPDKFFITIRSENMVCWEIVNKWRCIAMYSWENHWTIHIINIYIYVYTHIDIYIYIYICI